MHVGQKEKSPIPPATPAKVLERVQPGRVNRRHVTHADDQDLRCFRDLPQGVLELFGGAKEEWSVDLEHLDAIRNVPVAHGGRTSIILPIVVRPLACYDTDLPDLGHPPHEEKS